MSETSNGEGPYRVVYSEFVRKELLKLIARATERGLSAQVLSAVRKLDHLLHTNPRCGDPLLDLSLAPGQLRILTVPPLVVRYGFYENARLVIVTSPIESLPNAGF